MNLQNILDITNYILGKETEGNTLTGVNFNALLPKATNDVFNAYIYREFDTEQKYTDASLPFKVFMGQESYVDNNSNTVPAIAPLMINDNGYANIPSDYKHYSAIKYKKITNKPGCGVKISHRDVMVLTDQEFDGYQNSSLKKGTLKYPVCNFQKGFIRFAPKELKMVNFVYLRYPKTPVYGYTLNSTTQLTVYNPATSVESEFRDEENYKLITMLLSYIGVNLAYDTVVNYAGQEQQKNLVI